jgi:hypothetical protein
VVLAAEALEEEALAANFSKVFKNQRNFVVMEMALFKKKEKTLNCPKDQNPMIKLTSQGVTVDKCQECGGMWLDKGEMKKIIEKFDAHQKKLAKQQNK